MTRTYSLLLEGDESGYSAYVPELPTILVTANSEVELTERAAKGAERARLFLLQAREVRALAR